MIFFRSKGSGLCMLLSQAGSAISPWVVQGLKKYHISLPFFIMGVTLVIPSLLALTLKETKGIHIKDILTTGKYYTVIYFIKLSRIFGFIS